MPKRHPAAEPALADSKDLFPIIVQDSKHWRVEDEVIPQRLHPDLRAAQRLCLPEGARRYFFICVCEIEKSILACAQGLGAGCWVRLKLTFQRDVRYAPRFEPRTQMFSGAVVAHCHL